MVTVCRLLTQLEGCFSGLLLGFLNRLVSTRVLLLLRLLAFLGTGILLVLRKRCRMARCLFPLWVLTLLVCVDGLMIIWLLLASRMVICLMILSLVWFLALPIVIWQFL